MSVAPSFQNFEFLSDPFIENNKTYIKVRNPKTGTVRTVRWYEDKTKTITVTPPIITKKNPQKNALGFQKDYVTIFKGNTELYTDWFNSFNARYCKWWGWYIVSTEEIPFDLPAELTPVALPWSFVGDDKGCLKSDESIKTMVESLLYDAHPSRFIAEVGHRIEKEIIVTKNIPIEGNYGQSFIHVMEDKENNVYVWITSAKDWPIGTRKKIRGTIKDHKIYRNVKQNILTNCREVK